MKIVFGLLMLLCLAYVGYQFWYVSRETPKKGGNKPSNHSSVDKH